MPRENDNSLESIEEYEVAEAASEAALVIAEATLAQLMVEVWLEGQPGARSGATGGPLWLDSGASVRNDDAA